MAPTTKKATKATRKKSTAKSGQTAGSNAAVRKNKGGRPSALNDAVAEEILSRIAIGKDGKPESLRQICADDHMPAHSTVNGWLVRGEKGEAPFAEFLSRYAHAREAQADALADEMLEEARGADEKNAAAKRLLVDTLKWRAGKLRPKVYGDKLDLNHGNQPDNPLTSIVKQAGAAPLVPPGVGE